MGDSRMASKVLRLKLFCGPGVGETFCLKNAETEHRIGRTPNSDIKIDDKLLSKN